jgi:hypothetical protein
VQAWGWPARELDGGHLDLYVDPNRVADHIRDLVEQSPAATA